MPNHILNWRHHINFLYYFDKEIVDKIVEETNLYSLQKNPNSPEYMKVDDIQTFFGILIFMSVYHYPSVRSYWSVKYSFDHIKNTMTVSRFEKIHEIIHFNNNEKHLPQSHINHDRYFKIRPLVEHLNNKFFFYSIRT